MYRISVAAADHCAAVGLLHEQIHGVDKQMMVSTHDTNRYYVS